MRRRDALRLLGGGFAGSLAVGSLPGSAAAHPTPAGTDATGTSAPRVDAGYGPLGRVELPGATEAVVSADGTTAFVAVGDGFAVVDVSDPAEPSVVAERRGINVSRDLLAGDLGRSFDSVTDVAVDGDTLVVVNDGGGISGALVVDVSDPESPEERAFHETTYRIHNCEVADGRAYLTADYSGGRLDVLDVAGEPERVGSWSITDHDESWGSVPNGARDVHDVTVQDGVAYLAHWDAGTWLVDLQDPDSPSPITHIGRDPDAVVDAYGRDADTAYSMPGNAHYAAVDEAGDLLAVGREARATETLPEGGPAGIDLYDVSSSSDPSHRATIVPPRDPDGRGGVWTTPHNFDLRNGVLYSSWYNGGVKRHDVSDPADPRELTWWADPPHAEFWAARAAVPGGSFVATSRGTGRSPARLYTFPDGPGETAWGYGEGIPEDLPTREPSTAAEVSAPGYGPLSALAGIGVAGALAWWRERS
ncbi:hypothetical protein JCM30237_15920 [Halolamina litorea]|uniref:LVIVD repeat-containing protein n=1 Tax=Halolamina litorea TaxID=1515593 RepID=A0ABD6BMK8_9EURY|nr:hypothetical protein [Halolamina litorea]